MKGLLSILAFVSLSPAFAASPLNLVPNRNEPSFFETRKEKKALELAGQRALDYLRQVPPNSVFDIGGRSVTPLVLSESIRYFLKLLKESRSRVDFAARLKKDFDVYESLGLDGKGRVIFSDYYEPVLPASFRKTSVYRYPLYRLPLEKSLQSLSRRKIDVGHALAGKGLEIAWLKDRFDAFDLQVQGSGILRFPHGVEILASFAATNGLPYKAVGTVLVKEGVFKKGQITKDALRAYLKSHPQQYDRILSQDPRYVFFKLDPFKNGQEPQGTSHEPLVPGTSIAVDPQAIPLGTLAYMETISPRADRQGRFLGQFKRRSFAFCLDTGGAIKGPGRVDIYVGHGKRARTISSNQWSAGRLFILIKKK